MLPHPLTNSEIQKYYKNQSKIKKIKGPKENKGPGICNKS